MKSGSPWRRVTNQEVGDGQTQATSIRVVTVSGSLQAVLNGVSSVLQQVMSHPRAAQLVELPFPFVPRLQAYAGASTSSALRAQSLCWCPGSKHVVRCSICVLTRAYSYQLGYLCVQATMRIRCQLSAAAH